MESKSNRLGTRGVSDSGASRTHCLKFKIYTTGSIVCSVEWRRLKEDCAFSGSLKEVGNETENTGEILMDVSNCRNATFRAS